MACVQSSCCGFVPTHGAGVIAPDASLRAAVATSSDAHVEEGRATPIRSYDDLLAPFYEGQKPVDRHRLGLEAEKFGVDAASGRPLQYEGPRSVQTLFERLSEHGWRPVGERPGGPPIALQRAGCSVTLEPGAQLELSGTPWSDVHQLDAELAAHLQELEEASRTLDVAWLGLGFHPFATEEQLPWVPKERYAIMREYLPTQGTRGRDMMRRTATVQVNLDYASEADAMRKLRAALKVSPVVTAMFANAPLAEGRVQPGYRSVRAEVWLDVDPHRTGLLAPLQRPGATFVDYVEWALDVPMFLIKRGGRIVANTGQSFRSFWRSGFAGHRATQADWKAHLGTLFPEVRLKKVIEVRGTDALPRALTAAVPALWAGLLYDELALSGLEGLVEPWEPHELESARRAAPRAGLGATLAGRPLVDWAERVVELAAGGLERRRRSDGGGQDERRYLTPLTELIQSGQTPADGLLEALGPLSSGREELPAAELIRRVQL